MSSQESYRLDRRFLYWVEGLTDTQFAYMLLAPIGIILGLLAFWPLIRTLEMSLYADSIVLPGELGNFVGLENYIELLTGDLSTLLPAPFLDPNRLLESSLIVTLVFTVVSVFIEALLGLLQALYLDRSFRGRRWVRLIILLPWAVPIAIHGMMFYLLFSPGIGFGVEWLQYLGLVSSAPLADTANSLLIIILADIWKTTPFVTLIILAGIQTIDRDYYNVAKVAGASKWQQFKEITFPLILPSILVALLFRSIQALKVYGIVEIMSGCNTVPTLSCMVVGTFRERFYGTSATIAVFTAVVVAIFVSIYLYRFREESL